jgi:hypothetical protein
MRALWLVHLAATLLMVGIIWFVQVVHYPLFSKVGREAYPAYQSAHMASIAPLVLVVMGLELLTAFALLGERPSPFPFLWAGVAFGLLMVAWFSTVFLQVPLHGRLSLSFDASAHRALVLTNWLRTFAWTGRGFIVLWFTGRMLNV